MVFMHLQELIFNLLILDQRIQTEIDFSSKIKIVTKQLWLLRNFGPSSDLPLTCSKVSIKHIEDALDSLFFSILVDMDKKTSENSFPYLRGRFIINEYLNRYYLSQIADVQIHESINI